MLLILLKALGMHVVSVCFACFLPVCWATSTSKIDGVFQCVLQLWAESPVCSNSNPVHLCYSHLSALRCSGGSAALSLRLASESHLQPQFRTPAGQMLLECCCKQLCDVSCDQSAANVSIRSGASSVSQAASKCRLSPFLRKVERFSRITGDFTSECVN